MAAGAALVARCAHGPLELAADDLPEEGVGWCRVKVAAAAGSGTGRSAASGGHATAAASSGGLAAAGVHVDSIAFDENRRPAVDDAALHARLVAGELQGLTFTSPSTVDHFVAGLDAESRAAAGRCMIVAIGRTTARRLDEVGLPATAVAAPRQPAMTPALRLQLTARPLVRGCVLHFFVVRPVDWHCCRCCCCLAHGQT